jgi:hypothetical protein
MDLRDTFVGNQDHLNLSEIRKAAGFPLRSLQAGR